MEKIYKLVVFVLAFSSFQVAYAQTVNLKFIEAPAVLPSEPFETIVQISGSSTYTLGGFNIMFTYNNEALGVPTIVERYNFDSGNYAAITLTFDEKDPSLVGINGFLTPNTAGTTVIAEPEWMDIIKIQFKRVDINQTAKLAFLPSSGPEGRQSLLFEETPTSFSRLETGQLENLDARLDPTPLPVTFISFTGALVNKQVVLNWSTAVEVDNKEFQIERSKDGLAFETVASVAGSGTSMVANHYIAVDKNPLAGFNYYRLKQIDYNGAYEYSKLINVKAGQAQPDALVKFGPNPFNQNASVSFASVPQTEVLLTMTDVHGKVIKEEKIRSESSQTHYSLKNLDQLAKGVYIMKVAGPGVSSSFKVMKD